MTDEKRTTVTLTRHFSAPPEAVFDAWLDPAKAGRFLFATPHGTMVKVQIDARAGGHFLIVENREGIDIEHHGTYIEIDRPRHLVFDFSVFKFPASRVSLSFTKSADGCELTLLHEGVYEEYKTQTTLGWKSILDELENIINPVIPAKAGIQFFN